MSEKDIVFSDRIRAEQTDHNEMLTRLLKENPAQHARTANFHVVLTEGGNGLADITIDPLLTIEDKMPSSQKELMHAKFSLGSDLKYAAKGADNQYHLLTDAKKLSKTFIDKKKAERQADEDKEDSWGTDDEKDEGKKEEEKKPEAEAKAPAKEEPAKAAAETKDEKKAEAKVPEKKDEKAPAAAAKDASPTKPSGPAEPAKKVEDKKPEEKPAAAEKK